MQISTEQIAEMLQCKSGPVCLPLCLPPSLPHVPFYTVHAFPIMCFKTSAHSSPLLPLSLAVKQLMSKSRYQTLENEGHSRRYKQIIFLLASNVAAFG